MRFKKRVDLAQQEGNIKQMLLEELKTLPNWGDVCPIDNEEHQWESYLCIMEDEYNEDTETVSAVQVCLNCGGRI